MTPPPPPGPPPCHPLATVAIVLSVVPTAGGVIGAGLGAVSGIAIRRQPERWSGASRADAAVIVGLLTGPMLLALYGALSGGPQGESWGWYVFGAALAYAALVAGALAAGRRGARGAAAGAALGVLGVVGLLGTAVGVVLLVVWLVRMMAEGIADG